MSATSVRLGWRSRPEFLIIGAQKCGTSALHTYLSGHPQLAPAFAKELEYFCPETYRHCSDHPQYERFARFDRGEFDPAVQAEASRWYHSQFRPPLPGRPRVNFESTPCYLFFPDSARRIHAYRPDMKLIVLLRDPVERAYSAWNMFRQFTDFPHGQLQDKRTFVEALRDELRMLDEDPRDATTDYLRRGIYHEQLARYFELFPREQILILEQSDLGERRWHTLNAICEFLGVPPFECEGDWPPVLVGNYEAGMADSTREFLTEFFAPHNQALFRLLGREFAWTQPAKTSLADNDTLAPTPLQTSRRAAR